MSELNNIALKILENGKGILAADESTGTMTKRLESVSVPSTPENRLLFRETLLSSSSMSSCIGGVILYDETIKQKTSNNKTIPNLISSLDSVPGVKVDTGAKVLAGSPDEKITEGLDGLRERLKEYYQLGARFTKWRGVYSIGKKNPSQLAINSNAHALARYSALVQEAGMVPIVEPEVLMDGSHSIERCYEVSSAALKSLFSFLAASGVNIKGTILKPNMVTSGSLCESQASITEVAEMPVRCLQENVPSDLPGITFLSGGQSDINSTAHLDAMNKIGGFPWKLSFSYGRALQQAALKTWLGKIENMQEAQASLSHRASMNKLAAQGAWSSDLEG